MNVVARLLTAEGHTVSGSDREESVVLEQLRELGVATSVGHNALNVPSDAVVVRSSAIKPDNPEMIIAVERGQEIWHRSQALAYAAGDRDFIAVAGAHGKTSTSAMIAVALGELGADPSRAIGGHLAGAQPGGYLGIGSAMVAEADESDGSFLNYSPRIAVVTNVEPDHLDHYGSTEKFQQAFVDFANKIVPGGLLICCTDDPGARWLADIAREAGRRVATYGTRPYPGDHTLVIFDTNYRGKTQIGAQRASQTVNFVLPVPGEHMGLNAVGAWLACCDLGYEPQACGHALESFRGTGRRFEVRGEVDGIRVIDDYAHHPTEVEATLHTARSITSERVHVIFQPHLYSRTKNFASAFAQALDLADDVIVTSVYAAREVPTDGVEGDAIVELSSKASYEPDMSVAARLIAQRAKPGDVILTMGAGNITRMAAVIIDELNS